MSPKIKNVPSCFTPAELAQYLDKIGLGSTPRPLEPTLDTLTKVTRHHLTAFMFENLGMHYSDTHIVDPSPSIVFRRAVLEGRGSWCFGLNGLLLEMLRAIGFKAYACCARVEGSKVQAHALSLVTPSDTRGATYMVDAGFAARTAVWPIRLRHGETVPGVSTGEEQRLVRAAHPASSIDWSDDNDGSETLHPGTEGEGAKVDDLGPMWNQNWAFESRQSASSAWIPLLHFSTTEMFIEDFCEMSIALSLKPSGLFWPSVLVVKFFVEEDSEGDADGEDGEAGGMGRGGELGRLILHQNILKRKFGRVALTGSDMGKEPAREEVLEVFNTERERVAALKKYFGIEITDAEVGNIQGRVSALPL
ncbi:hypothetical protein BOTBODRAFT_180195 [Botryobasidium botryosum FD-172 SS1]|uniref:Uncharacterized protein n=1 Tax=Botryobasidium botryosum (strain FD-172 SS1) TaxID=930990 RepID=A0A067LXU9_BOTB1|nr:hypothetical protein BOTBODRAFT_180195 [Botryobasidium botryosum FD-172 SS1]